MNKEISRLEGTSAKQNQESSSADEDDEDDEEVEEIPRHPHEIGSNVESVTATTKLPNRPKRTRDVSGTPEPYAGKLRPKKLPDYYGKNIREYREWIRDAQTAFRQARLYFPTEESKILYAIGFLKGDPKEMWYNHEAKHPAETLTFEDFSIFLLNNIEDPVNRSLDAQQRYEDAHQLQSQTV